VDPLTGSERDAPEILDSCYQRLRQESWDLAIFLTDLPLYRGGRLVVADISTARGIGGISLPALGATRLRAHARSMSILLTEALRAEGQQSAGRAAAEGSDIHAVSTRREWLMERVALFRRVEPPDDDMKDLNVDARFVASKLAGHLRLLAGMVLANRP
jgi:hypothetical protein